MGQEALADADKARAALVVFRRAKNKFKEFVDYRAFRRAQEKYGVPPDRLADAFELAIAVGLVAPVFERGFALTNRGRRAMERDVGRETTGRR